jgi:hypothetical protein
LSQAPSPANKVQKCSTNEGLLLGYTTEVGCRGRDTRGADLSLEFGDFIQET